MCTCLEIFIPGDFFPKLIGHSPHKHFYVNGNSGLCCEQRCFKRGVFTERSGNNCGKTQICAVNTPIFESLGHTVTDRHQPMFIKSPSAKHEMISLSLSQRITNVQSI